MNAPIFPVTRAQPHRFTGEDVMRMQAAGVLQEGGKFELIEGEIIDIPAEGGAHLDLKESLNRLLVSTLPATIGVVPDGTLRLAERTWPEPDFYMYAKPGRAIDVRGPDVLLVIEIADSTLSDNLGRKARLYREHGVREYWVIDVQARVTYVHRADGAWPSDPPSPFAAMLTSALVPELAVCLDDFVIGDG